MIRFEEWTVQASGQWIAVPSASDDKYSRGVLGVMTGSQQYPGAAVLGVDAALHTGVGMVRYLGPERPTNLVLARRPEAVTTSGRVQAWLLGSGMDVQKRGEKATAQLRGALASGAPVIVDAGALDLVGEASGPAVVTPHYSELASLLGVEVAEIASDPGNWAIRASDRLGVAVLLKGRVTYLSGFGQNLSVETQTTWLATAGTGDALGGILGALIATHTDQIAREEASLVRLAATAAIIHGQAAEQASGGGPFTVLELCEKIPGVIARLLNG